MTTLKQKREDAIKQIETATGGKNVHVCMSSDMHPYNCDGPFGGECIHCDEVIEDGHNPKTCALCNWMDYE